MGRHVENDERRDISKRAKTPFCIVDNTNSHDLSMQYGFQIITLFNVCIRSTSFLSFKYMMRTLP